jgi:chemotaxis protein MotB
MLMLTGIALPNPPGNILPARSEILHPHSGPIEGHTDSKPYVGLRDYGNWELSVDRANPRRLIQEKGLAKDQVSQVRGFADQKLHKPDKPLDPSNRRITVIVQYIAKQPEDDSQEQPLPPAQSHSAADHPAESITSRALICLLAL